MPRGFDLTPDPRSTGQASKSCLDAYQQPGAENGKFRCQSREPSCGWQLLLEKGFLTVSITTHSFDDALEAIQTGIVFKKSTGNYTIQANGRVIQCGIAARLRTSLAEAAGYRTRGAIERMDPLAVGDEVRYVEVSDGMGLIVEQLPRRNHFSRRSAVPMPTARPYEQVIAANVDQVVPVFAASEPPPKWNMLDRYLVSAEAAELPALICITKLDLVQDLDSRLDAELEQAVEEYRRIGYPVMLVSAFTGQGLSELKQALQGRISVLLGKSGVGKTSLLNELQPGLGLQVNAVSQLTGKGRHTTTHMEMFPLQIDHAMASGAIIDTPGVREFGLWIEDGQDLDWYFPEMRPYLSGCRFGLGCEHDQEPGCAVCKAVTERKISPRRWKSYLQLRGEV
jgi:ribosome biogenesis GTPase